MNCTGITGTFQVYRAISAAPVAYVTDQVVSETEYKSLTLSAEPGNTGDGSRDPGSGNAEDNSGNHGSGKIGEICG